MMKFTIKSWLSLGVAVLTLSAAMSVNAAGDVPGENRYVVLATLSGPDGMWDDATVSGHRLYVTQTENISILDLDGSAAGAPSAWTQIHVPRATWHDVVPMESRGLLLATNGEAHAVAMFDAQSKKPVATVLTNPSQLSALTGKMAAFATLADPDALVADPKSGLLAAVNGGSGEVIFIDVDRKSVVGRVRVGGKLEFAIADGKGSIFVNVQNTHAIAVIDTRTFKVTRRLPMTGCTEPKGLAYDVGTDLLISGCDNGVAKFIIAGTGQVLASLTIGRGADAVMIDGERHRAYVAGGDDATLSIFNIEDPGRIALLQTLLIEKGTRLGAVDQHTGLLYLPSGKLGPPVAPRPWPSVLPGSFHVLVVGLGKSSGDR